MFNIKSSIILIVIIIAILAGLLYFFPSHFEIKPKETPARNDAVLLQNTNIKNTQPKKNARDYLGRDGVYVVQYTNNGFIPQELQIPKGKSIRFINVSDKSLQVFSDDKINPKFTELNQSKTIGRGGTYTFSFVIDGLWTYHNEIYKTHTGNIFVY